MKRLWLGACLAALSCTGVFETPAPSPGGSIALIPVGMRRTVLS